MSQDGAQPGLFDERPKAPAPRPARQNPAPFSLSHSPRKGGATIEARTVTIDDMPEYPPHLHKAVDQMLADLRPDRVLMTYRGIEECFGVSRSTVARRVKEGLVPGVRIASAGRVLQDASVRRFDRTQLRWLLLAVRFGGRESPSL